MDATRRTVELLYGQGRLPLRVPRHAEVLRAEEVRPLADPEAAVREALAAPVGCAPLLQLVRARRPRTVAVTVSDITRPVPNHQILPALLEVLAAGGVEPDQVLVVVGTGMHHPSTEGERERFLGREVLGRVEVVDHTADRPETLVRLCDDPPVSVNARFAAADLRVVTGLIEPHFMAGFSGGRKGVCPALVDLQTIQRFHSYETLNHPLADNGVLTGNPCHEIGLEVARRVGVDFLVNVAVTRERQMAGVYCGQMEAAHQLGCEEVGRWNTARVDGPVDLVITNGGGFPLDQTFYQTIKGMVSALPALGPQSTLLQLARCDDSLGSEAYTELLLRWGHDWQGFEAEASRGGETRLDQWELQMQCKVLRRIGTERLWFASDGLSDELLARLALHPLPGPGDARQRAQAAIDRFLDQRPGARVAVIPEGPYTMLGNGQPRTGDARC